MTKSKNGLVILNVNDGKESGIIQAAGEIKNALVTVKCVGIN